MTPFLISRLSWLILLMGTALLGLSLGGCTNNAENDTGSSAEQFRSPNHPVAIVRTKSLQWEGEQTYIPLYADGSASGLVVVNFEGGLLYGTSIPDSWSWAGKDTVEICGSVNILRNEVDFPPMKRDCAPHPITGKELDQDEDGNIDLIETFTILHPLFYTDRPHD